MRAGNGARTNRLEAAPRASQQIEETTTKQLSDTEDADIAKTLIDLNSQTAAYQAALQRRGEHRAVVPHGLPALDRAPLRPSRPSEPQGESRTCPP